MECSADELTRALTVAVTKALTTTFGVTDPCVDTSRGITAATDRLAEAITDTGREIHDGLRTIAEAITNSQTPHYPGY